MCVSQLQTDPGPGYLVFILTSCKWVCCSSSRRTEEPIVQHRDFLSVPALMLEAHLFSSPPPSPPPTLGLAPPLPPIRLIRWLQCTNIHISHRVYRPQTQPNEAAKRQNKNTGIAKKKQNVIAFPSSSSRILNRAAVVKAQIVPVGRFEACGPGGAAGSV